MPYILRGDGVDDLVTTGDIGTALDFDAEIKCTYRSIQSSYRAVFGGYKGGQPNRWCVGHAGGSWWMFLRGNHYISGTSVAVDTEYTIKIVRRGTSYELFVNGVSVLTATNSGILYPISSIFAAGDGGAFKSEIDLEYFSYTDINTPANNQYFDASGTSSGLVLPETTGNGVDGNLVGFPTDNSQWVFVAGTSTLPTPINLSISNIRANSVRLNWGQG